MIAIGPSETVHAKYGTVLSVARHDLVRNLVAWQTLDTNRFYLHVISFEKLSPAWTTVTNRPIAMVMTLPVISIKEYGVVECTYQ